MPVKKGMRFLDKDKRMGGRVVEVLEVRAKGTVCLCRNVQTHLQTNIRTAYLLKRFKRLEDDKTTAATRWLPGEGFTIKFYPLPEHGGEAGDHAGYYAWTSPAGEETRAAIGALKNVSTKELASLAQARPTEFVQLEIAAREWFKKNRDRAEYDSTRKAIIVDPTARADFERMLAKTTAPTLIPSEAKSIVDAVFVKDFGPALDAMRRGECAWRAVWLKGNYVTCDVVFGTRRSFTLHTARAEVHWPVSHDDLVADDWWIDQAYPAQSTNLCHVSVPSVEAVRMMMGHPAKE